MFSWQLLPLIFCVCHPHMVVDSGVFSGGSRISERRGCQPQRWGRQPIILINFSWKLHEIERIWTERGGAHTCCHPIDLPMVFILFLGGASKWQVDALHLELTLPSKKSWNPPHPKYYIHVSKLASSTLPPRHPHTPEIFQDITQFGNLLVKSLFWCLSSFWINLVTQSTH